MNIKITLAVVACWISASAFSQSPILEGYIQEGLQSNLQLKQETLNYERSVENVEQARALFFPQVSANSSYTIADGGRKIPVDQLVNPLITTVNALANTDIPLQTSFQLFPTNFHDTKIRVIQPIFNPDIYFNYKAQKELVSVQTAQKRAFENELKYAVADAYYNYLRAYEALEVLKKTRVLVQELARTNQKLVDNDKATRDAILNAEYEVSKIDYQLSDTEKNKQVAQAYFNFLLNKDLGASIAIDTALTASLSARYTIEDLTASAMAKRQELVQIESGLKASGRAVDLHRKDAILPKLSFVGDVGYQGDYYKFQSDQRYWLVQFSLTWDLFQGGVKKSKTQQARIDYQIVENKMQQVKKQIELQVIQAYRTRESAQQAYLAARSGVKNAARSFQIIRTKYNEGQVILLEYLDAQNKLTTSQLTETLSTYELLRADAFLQKTIANL